MLSVKDPVDTPRRGGGEPPRCLHRLLALSRGRAWAREAVALGLET